MRILSVQIEINGCQNMTETQIVAHLNAWLKEAEEDEFEITAHGNFFEPNAAINRLVAFGDNSIR